MARRVDPIHRHRGARHDRARRSGRPHDRGARKSAMIAASFLGLGVVLGVVGLFPDYLGGTSLAQQPADLVAHTIYLAVWATSVLLIVLGGTRLRIGTLLGLGMSAVTFGLFFADAGTPIAGGAHLMGAGLIFGLVGWLACATGGAIALRGQSAGAPGRPNHTCWVFSWR